MTKSQWMDDVILTRDLTIVNNVNATSRTTVGVAGLIST